jgi:hypothetical protein
MGSFHEYMREYKKQIERGDIQKAYKGLMEYIMGLRMRLKTNTPIISYLAAFITDIWI